LDLIQRAEHGPREISERLGPFSKVSDDPQTERRVGLDEVGEGLAVRGRAENQHESGVATLLAQPDQEAPKQQAGQERSDRQKREETEQDQTACTGVLGREEEADDDRG